MPAQQAFARVLAPELSEAFGPSFVVDNKAEAFAVTSAVGSAALPAEFMRQIETKINKWAAVVKASGATVD